MQTFVYISVGQYFCFTSTQPYLYDLVSSCLCTPTPEHNRQHYPVHGTAAQVSGSRHGACVQIHSRQELPTQVCGASAPGMTFSVFHSLNANQMIQSLSWVKVPQYFRDFHVSILASLVGRCSVFVCLLFFFFGGGGVVCVFFVLFWGGGGGGGGLF